MIKRTIIQELNEKAIKDEYLYDLLWKIQHIYGARLFNKKTEDLTKKEFSDILRFSDILSRSNEPLNRNIALKIIATLYTDYHKNEVYQLFAQNVMIKLGNFPSLKLLENDGIKFDNLELEYDKRVKKYFQYTVTGGNCFTDSQYDIFRKIVNSNHYSFSAGTSFGKSFLFSEFINWIIQEKNENIVFLVPSRALITQVVEDLKDTLIDKDYKIVSNPEIPALFRGKGLILVLTPERLVSYFSKNTNPNISTMIIDEAQNVISNDERSPIFYHAITLAEQKSVKLYFASPNIPNPEIFLELVGNSKEESKQILDVNVSQNKYFVDFISKKYRIYYDFLTRKKYDEFEMKIDDFYAFLMRVTEMNQSIIYCNSTNKVLEYARVFSKSVGKCKDNDILNLANYIRKNIHDKYYLAELIEKGIAFHFGALPQEIRKKIEKLFKIGKIKYLFTTSTLLQGVNLPAKNLFILSDKIGVSRLKEFDFYNLIGRAGRLSKELYGNIFIVKTDDKSKTKELLNLKKVPNIKSQVLSGQGNFYINVGNVLDGKNMTNKNLSASKKREIADYATILTYHQKKNIPSQLVDKFIQKNKDSSRLIKKMRGINVPEDVLMISTNIKTKYQEEIYMLDEPYIFGEISNWKDCRRILRILSKIYNWEEEDKRRLGNVKRLEYYAVLMFEWIRSKPLSAMIQSTINYHEKNKVEIRITPNSKEIFSIDKAQHINYVINELLKDIDNVLKFKIKNYIINYLKLTDQEDNEWQNYLEYGTFDKTIIELQKIGFDRAIAMELNKYKSKHFNFNTSGEIIDIDINKLLEKELSSEARYQVKLLLT
ncbi:DEAD/DEAH box helicase [Lactobacillus agilis]|uniref:DEAD/DEAH box helicase n=1 Tax=Ligilactobacillus agilis TaxID=1601 RepID=A0A848C947_9LACO|nr:DEAD/DEAH box helicase [Ligilactobacillus agilis]NME42577.1 DEAD/DEAH box helicase [Ligilactobacillus agilis]